MACRFALLPTNRPEGDTSLNTLDKYFEREMLMHLDPKDAEEELGLALVEVHDQEGLENAGGPNKDKEGGGLRSRLPRMSWA